MRKFLFVLASTATLAMMNPAKAQTYLSPVNPGVPITPGYVAPGYVAPGYVASGYTAPGSTAPDYMWREQRANEDWRNNTWREKRFDQDWRNNNWRTERAMEDWRQRENYEKQRTPNNATDRGFVGTDTRYVGECAIGSSEETCRRRGQRYNPPNNADNRGLVGSDGTIISGAGDRGLVGSDGTIINGADRAYGGECPIGVALENCRTRGLRYHPLTNPSKGGATVGQKNNAVDTGYVGECAIGSSVETCRRRGQR
jgi:hypothetical protein